MITVHFAMADRNEYDVDVTDCAGQPQQALKALAEERLLVLIAERVPQDKVTIKTHTIVSWRTLDTDAVEPSVDKKDGITAVRSSLQKVRLDLLPMIAQVQVARVFTFGAAQYGDQNWREGFSYSRCYGAALRHLAKWNLGEEVDDESGITHLAHAVANLMFLIEYQASGRGTDDRIKIAPDAVRQLFARFNVEIDKQ